MLCSPRLGGEMRSPASRSDLSRTAATTLETGPKVLARAVFTEQQPTTAQTHKLYKGEREGRREGRRTSTIYKSPTLTLGYWASLSLLLFVHSHLTSMLGPLRAGLHDILREARWLQALRIHLLPRLEPRRLTNSAGGSAGCVT